MRYSPSYNAPGLRRWSGTSILRKQAGFSAGIRNSVHSREICDFICDSLRMMIIGATTPQELDQLMELDIDVQRRGRHQPVVALQTVADALPGLGIVAAVLGVVITMQAIGGAPETVGQKVAAALVGTFLGILLCYGVVGPVASRLEGLAEEQAQFLQVMRVAICSFVRGASPMLAVEYARRSIPVDRAPRLSNWRRPSAAPPRFHHLLNRGKIFGRRKSVQNGPTVEPAHVAESD